MRGTKHLLARLDALQKAVESDVPKTIEDTILNEAAKAEGGFATATYEGNNDVVVSVDGKADAGAGQWDINATGTAVLFIEYGTGIKLPHNSEFGDYGMFPPGSWSMTHSGYLTDPKMLQRHHGQWPYNGMWTDGNPSANVMYTTQKYLRDYLPMESIKSIRKANQ